MNKKLNIVIGISILLSFSFSYAKESKQNIVSENKNSLPPTYLSIDGYKKCLSSIKKESSKSWCLPENQSTECPGASWEQLKFNKDSLPYCTQNAEYATMLRNLNKWRPSASWVFVIYMDGFDSKESQKLDQALNYGLKKECDLKGSVQSGDFSLNTSSSWCANVSMKLMQSRLQKVPSVNTPFLLEYKDSSFYINNHKVLNNIKS